MVVPHATVHGAMRGCTGNLIRVRTRLTFGTS